MYVDTKQGPMKLVVQTSGRICLQAGQARPKEITPKEADLLLSEKMGQIRKRAILELQNATTGAMVESIFRAGAEKTAEINFVTRLFTVKETKQEAASKTTQIPQSPVAQVVQQTAAAVAAGSQPSVLIEDAPKASKAPKTKMKLKRRGRPPGAKNKPKEISSQVQQTQPAVVMLPSEKSDKRILASAGLGRVRSR